MSARATSASSAVRLTVAARRTAIEVLAALQSQGVTLTLDREMAGDSGRTGRGAAYTLRARPTEAVTPAISGMVRPHRDALIALLREKPPLQDFLIESAADDSYLVSPDYCPSCGNLDFYADNHGWYCAWCRPQEINAVALPRLSKKFVTDTLKAGGKLPDAKIIVEAERTPHILTESFFTEAQIAAAWPDGWVPPFPLGPAAVVAAMCEGERASIAAYERARDHARQSPDCQPFAARESAASGRAALLALQEADRADLDNETEYSL